MMTSLEPLDGDLDSEVHELALALRRLFAALEVGVRRYAARRSRDAGSVSRYLNGTRIPSWEFVADLLADVGEARGAMMPETVDLLRNLHSAALAASASPQHRVQLLEQRLAAADLAARRSAVRERALEDALLDAQRRVGNLELQLRQLTAGPHSLAVTGSLRGDQEDLAAVRQERDDLRGQIADLRIELKDAHTRRVQAELRCAELERELDQADHVESDGKSGDSTFGTSGQMLPGAALVSPTRDELTDWSAHASLDSKYIFDNFAVNSGNRFAHDVAVAVAEAPGGAYNPLYLFGDNGRGKTHLLHAIGHYTRTLYPNSRVRYISTPDALPAQSGWDQGSSLLDASLIERADVLLIDDINWLAGRTGREQQAALVATLRRHIDAGKQLVCAAPLPADRMSWSAGLDRLLQGGVCLGISAPSHEQLLTVLTRKADADGIAVPDEALGLLAGGAGGSIRELEGALTRVAAYASLNHCSIDAELTRTVLTGLTKSRRGEITGEAVLQTVADHFGTTVEDLRSAARGRRLVTARHIAMYLCRELTDYPVPTIAALLGSKDPAAVLHAHRKTRNLMRQRPSQYKQVSHITSRILFSPDGEQSSPGDIHGTHS
ncbi:DnaA ATPase domain-containing protein [Streptomyces sp. WAC 05379]|uniref:DnaA ATPase domain-containing protein n=1 Tax=Streptomyces sp. WAC 05379 TaxID=2203207 RepID=UPI00163B6960|nr:DnaA/Hda family protein [Streptomyces sp. WAC 05379]